MRESDDAAWRKTHNRIDATISAAGCTWISGSTQHLRDSHRILPPNRLAAVRGPAGPFIAPDSYGTRRITSSFA